MLVFVHGLSSSGKTTTARLLVSEKNLNLVFSGTTGTASSLYKAETIKSFLYLRRTVENFDAGKKHISAHVKTKILSKFVDGKILIIDIDVEPCNVALIDPRQRQCLESEKPFGGLHIILIGDRFQFPAIGRKFKKVVFYQAVVVCSRNRKLPNKGYRDGANLFMKFRLLK